MKHQSTLHVHNQWSNTPIKIHITFVDYELILPDNSCRLRVDQALNVLMMDPRSGILGDYTRHLVLRRVTRTQLPYQQWGLLGLRHMYNSFRLANSYVDTLERKNTTTPPPLPTTSLDLSKLKFENYTETHRNTKQKRGSIQWKSRTYQINWTRNFA